MSEFGIAKNAANTITVYMYRRKKKNVSVVKKKTFYFYEWL